MLYEGSKEVYLTYQLYDTEEFTVSSESVYDYLVEDGPAPKEEVSEEYTKLADAKKTRYGKTFEMLRRMCGKLGEEV